MSQNSMITIVIPTYNRPVYLKRLLGYYSECGLPHQIIIADGSLEEIRKVNRQTVASFSNLQILHLDKYSAEIKFNERTTDALKHVNTKYCVICADDDFITLKGMDQSVDFLEGNPDYSVCHGQYIFFAFEDETAKEQKLLWSYIYSHESSVSDDSAVRVYRQLSEYPIATFYAVHKTEFMRWIWDETLKNTNETDALFSEMLLSTLTLIYGKMKCLDLLYSVKDHNPNRTGYIPTFKDYQKAGTYKKQYTEFRQCLAEHLVKQSQFRSRKAKKLIDEAMAVYMKLHYPPPNKPSKISRFYLFILNSLAFTTNTAGQTMDWINYHGKFRDKMRTLYNGLRSNTGQFKVQLVKKIDAKLKAEPKSFAEHINDDLSSSLEKDEDIIRIKPWILFSIRPSAK